MQKRVEEHIFQGMQRDMSISKQKPEFLWDAHNIRLTARHGDTLLSITNEKGTVLFDPDCIVFEGVVLGYCVLGEYLTVFTTDPTAESKPDHIYRLKKEDDEFSITELYNGNLNFKVNCPIECLGVYENVEIQKVYWTDGQNQPRMINITKKLVNTSYIDTSFDFIPTLALKDTIHVTKVADSSGIFAAGVIQYAVTYYNKYGQESNVSVVSPLIPTSYTQRAGSPEETIGNAFKVTVKNPDLHFEFMRIYSIFRSSKDTTPVCKRVADVRLGYGGESALNLYKDNAKTTRYARIDFSTAEIKTDWNSDFVLLNSPANDGYKGTKTVDFDSGMIFSANRYYHFTKQNTPYLIIKARVYNDHDGKWNAEPTFFTWESCAEIYLAMDPGVKGPGNWNHQLMWANGGGGYMYRADYMYYGTSDFIVNNAITITDNGTIGEDIDYNELLFVGGEEITAGTITQKDGTMFLGDIKIKRPQVESNDLNIIDDIRDVNVNSVYRKCCFPITMNSSSYKWGNTLDAHIYTNSDTGENTNIAGFKHGEHYRLGFQFQYKTGKWSQPVFINDVINTKQPSLQIQDDIYVQSVPSFTANLPTTVADKLLNNGYRRVRGVICFPKESDQLILCQGLLNPTVHSIAGRLNHTPDVQSSWYFRPIPTTTDLSNDVGYPQYIDKKTLYGGTFEVRTSGNQEHKVLIPTRHDEIQGVPVELSNKFISEILDENGELLPSVKNAKINLNLWQETGASQRDKLKFTIKDSRDLSNIFIVDWKYLTFHSPEFEFNDAFRNMDTSTISCRLKGKHLVATNQGTTHIITSSPPISTHGTGFYNRVVFSELSAYRINAGLFYKDRPVNYHKVNDEYIFDGANEDNPAYGDYEFSFLTYPWHRTGSLNNDCVRPAGKGNRSAMLSQKKLINLMYFGDNENYSDSNFNAKDIRVFNSDQVSLVKINNNNYFGNVDQVLSPFTKYPIGYEETGNDFDGKLNYLPTAFYDEATGDYIYKKGLYLSNDPIYMKYKSTPHAVLHTDYDFSGLTPGDQPYLFCAEIYREQNSATDFGGRSEHALQSNLWYPAGPAVEITRSANTPVEFLYGDTYYQRYDCLKTYPFTDEDTNSIIEIGSFMVETRINLDGRYDKNRGNTQNFMLNPTNFNLINPVYSQMDNFFNYRILDKDYYKLSEYPTMVTWTGYKNNAAEVDNWTNITLASTLEMDGTKGKVNAVKVNSDQLYCFQDDAVGQILFNSRVQISPSDGVPIEISNNYKVDGNRYISTSVGCKNKWSIAEGIDGLYFIDDNTKALYQLGGQAQLKPISTPINMSYWFMEQDCSTPWVQRYYISDTEIKQQGIRCFYDNANADLYICTPETTLCYSEKLGQFISFFDYHNVIAMFNIDSDYWSLNYPEYNSAANGIKLWQMFRGIYNTFYGQVYPTHFTFISNENPINDKIFSNIELRGDFRLWCKNQVWEDFDSPSHVIDHRKMFDTVRVWDEYQDTGDIDLDFINDVPSNMKKKFRIWRMDIPRDKDNPRQRIRNTWVKVKFTMNDLKPISLDDLNANISSEFIVWNNNEWTDLDLRNTQTNRYMYNPEDDCIDETTVQGGLLAKYMFNDNGTVLMKVVNGVKQPYAYRKIYDMEIHDIGVVYFA